MNLNNIPTNRFQIHWSTEASKVLPDEPFQILYEILVVLHVDIPTIKSAFLQGIPFCMGMPENAPIADEDIRADMVSNQ